MAFKNNKPKNNVVKFRPQFKLNLGIFVFGVIFIYLVIVMIRSANIETYSIYEVERSYIDTNISGTGLAIRQEKLINSSDSGYISYYIRDGEKVAKNATVYTVDETGSVCDTLSAMSADEETLTAEQYTDIRNRISMFNSYFYDTTYSDVYNFKYDLENVVLELSNEVLLEQLTSLDSSSDTSNTFKEIHSDKSGIVTYYQDGYENFDIYKIAQSDFDKDKYEKKTLKTGEIIGAGTPVYKLVTSENWNLIVMISEDDAKRLKEHEYVTINIANNVQNVTGAIEIIRNNDQYFANISLNKMLINYINDRFIDIEIIMDQNEGLKIPNSSIYKKQILKIPDSYLIAGANSKDKTFFNVEHINKDGEISAEVMSPTIYFMENGFCYVNPDDFQDGDTIVANNSTTKIDVSSIEKTTMDGVLCVNKGVATFKLIEIIYSSDDFTIVRPNVDYGINLYDRIVLDSTSIEENSIIR